MKRLIFSSCILALLAITACQKEGIKDKKYDKEYDKEELTVCEWDASKVADETIWEEHIIEPIVTGDDACDCIVSGQVKYWKIDTDFAYVIYYGKGECDQWAYLVTYEGEEKPKKCKFKMDCEGGN